MRPLALSLVILLGCSVDKGDSQGVDCLDFVGTSRTNEGAGMAILATNSPQELVPLLEVESGQWFSKANWDLGGESFVVVRERSTGTSITRISVFDAEAEVLVDLGSGEVRNWILRRSPGGSELAWLVSPELEGADYLMHLDLSTGEVEVLSSLVDLGISDEAQWRLGPSLEGVLNLYRTGQSPDATDPSMIAVDTEGNLVATRSEPLLADKSFVIWDPNGERLAYCLTQAGETSAYLVPSPAISADSPAEVLGSGCPTFWSRDGSLLVLGESLFDMRTTAVALDVPEQDFANARYFALSPDGKYLAVGAPSARVISLEDGSSTVFEQEDAYIHGGGGSSPVEWSADGRCLLTAKCWQDNHTDEVGCGGHLYPLDALLEGGGITEEPDFGDKAYDPSGIIVEGITNPMARPL